LEREKAEQEADARLAAERAENERLRMEAEAKERAARDRIQAECEQQAAKEKEAATASDSMKLELFIDTLKGISIPEFSTPKLRKRVSTLIFNLETDLLKLV
jgi:hypothetical protein